MAVREIWTSNGTTKVFKDRSIDKEARNVILGSVLANQASLVHRLYATEGCGDGMDVALLKLGHRLGARPKLCLDALPFDHRRRYTASLCDISHRRQLFVKGAPEIILGKATRIASDGRKVKINQAQRDAFNSAYRHLAARGQRVLAVARKEMPKSVAKLSDHEVTDLVILGLVGIEDAPRRAARSVIDILRRTGIDVKMVTGDLPATAYAVAREVGLAQDLQGIVSGERVVKLLSRSHSLCGIDVFARVLPEIKMAIVKHYQARGHRVAMIGDGINDVAALKVADIGVALVKQGAEVAQETADLAITDGNLATLKMALFEGREVWLKLRKVLFFLLSTNLAELAVVLVALLLGWPLPFTPVQILWINIITDLAIGQALIFGRGDLPMSFHGRELIPKWLGRQIAAAALWIAAVTLLVYHRFLALDSAAAATMAFVILIASQVANAYNGYALGASVFTVKWYRHFWIHLSAALVLFLTILSVNWAPLREFLGLASIGAGDFVRLVILGLSVVGFLEIAKLWYIKRKD